MRLPVRATAIVVAAALAAACAEPPSKEMNQAQGAIDAARAAGADRYAPDELAAATTALSRAEEAVTQRDFRLALSHALDSREQAQAAARQAVERRAAARGEAERAVAALTALVTRAQARLKDPEVARLPRRASQVPVRTIAAAASALQEARAALEADDYPKATAAAADHASRLQAALADIDAAVAARSTRRR